MRTNMIGNPLPPADPTAHAGRILLGLMPPSSVDASLAKVVNTPTGASFTHNPLSPRYLNLPPPTGFEGLPAPWGSTLPSEAQSWGRKVGGETDLIERRWPTLAA